ncbi:MAG: hypothetical protein AAGF11_54650 [Myxococcota bacterium]
MKTFMQYKDRRAADLDHHPFVQWLDADNVDITQKLMFAPIMTIFVMNFRDMNLWVLRFDEQPDEHFRSIINDNTKEDETHSRLFLEDWDKLELDAHLGWSALDTLWWLFASPQTECFRRFGVEFIRLNVDDRGDPMLRFCHSEAGEICGHVFFRHVVGPTARLGEVTGQHYRYFGHYHLDRELGHVIGSEGEFETQVLEPDHRARGMALGERMFDIFFEIFDAFDGYARTHVEAGSVPRAPTTIDPLPRRPPQPLPEALLSRQPRPSSSIAARHLAKVLQRRKQAVVTHPFYTWLREAQVPAVDKLRRFLPMWVMDILGYRDLNHYVMHYPEPTDDLQRAINAWAADLATHSTLLFSDWRALGMDEALGWGARQTLEFCFFDPSMDIHRRNIVKFIRLGLRHPDPTLRFWLMHALEASGEVFFIHTRELALAAEAQGVGPLDYLGDRHNGAHTEPERDTLAAIRDHFWAQPLSPEQTAAAETMIHVVFDSLEEQLTLSLEAAQSSRLLRPPTDRPAD